MINKSVTWYNRLSFQGIIGLLFFALLLVFGIIFIMSTTGKKLVSVESSKIIEQIGNNAVGRLTTRSTEIAALTKSLANLVKHLPKSVTSFKQTLPDIINFNGDLDVAGGGFWPEPHLFQPDKERRSFFWGRESDGRLKYYDDYNQPGPGYHHEEWYVAVRHTKPGTCSWSESYMDPYSYQPMVTCTVGVFNNDSKTSFSGTTTIDLKLEGLHALAESLSEKTGGYVFILDRNNKFITFPNPALVKRIDKDKQGNTTQEFILASEFAKQSPLFVPLSKAFQAMNSEILKQARQMQNYDPNIALAIDRDSYQIDQPKAELLAAVLVDPLKSMEKQTYLYNTVALENDFFLKTPSTAFIFHVPYSYWKLVIVKPNSEINAVASNIIELLSIYVLATMLIIMTLAYLSFNRFLIKPLSKTTDAIRQMGTFVGEKQFDQLSHLKIKHNRNDEIGLLIKVFDSLIDHVIEEHNRLEEANKVLDAKVIERTTELKAKIEELTRAHNELVQSEKMASLGRLVAGFAHELNTPIGVAVGSASTLQNKAKFINELLEQDEVDEDDLVSALETIDQAATLTLSNLRRAARLVSSFKRTAVDQTSEKVRQFDVKITIEDVIHTLHNQFKRTAIEIQVDCPSNLLIYSIPGSLEQIITNLMMNSLIHGFNQGKEAGQIQISVRLEEARLHIDYADTGKGIAPDALEKIFEPFFTTHRAHGGSGLGMYISYNIVTSQLNGTMTCESTFGEGVQFKIEFPVTFSLPE
jgi:signal transduction histidine kinase